MKLTNYGADSDFLRGQAAKLKMSYFDYLTEYFMGMGQGRDEARLNAMFNVDK